MQVKDARSLGSEAQEVLRKRAVQAVLEGKTHEEAAQLFSVARGTVSRWMGLYRDQGESGLDARPKGRSPHPTLKEEQAAIVVELVSRHSPDQLGLPFFLWTREAAGELIKRRFGLKLSRWTVGRYLRGWGFTPQKPARRAYQQNPEAVRRWLREEYPQVRREAELVPPPVAPGGAPHQCAVPHPRRRSPPEQLPGRGTFLTPPALWPPVVVAREAWTRSHRRLAPDLSLPPRAGSAPSA